MTTVACSATDAAGNAASGSFHVTVGDTGDPTLVGMPSNITLTTSNPAGAPLAYTMPTATDAADPNPVVSCLPAPGAIAPVGSSTVTCTATDAAGNSTTGTFGVSVTYVSSATYSATWGEPVGGSPAMLVTNSSRTIPIKLRLFVDGVEQTAGAASLRVTACGGGTALVVPLSWGSGRWSTHLDMSRLGAGCFVVAAMLNGNNAGSFALDVRGPDAAKSARRKAGPDPDGYAGPGRYERIRRDPVAERQRRRQRLRQGRQGRQGRKGQGQAAQEVAVGWASRPAHWHGSSSPACGTARSSVVP